MDGDWLFIFLSNSQPFGGSWWSWTQDEFKWKYAQLFLGEIVSGYDGALEVQGKPRLEAGGRHHVLPLALDMEEAKHSHYVSIRNWSGWSHTRNKSYYDGNRRKGVRVCRDASLVKRLPHASIRAWVQTPGTEWKAVSGCLSACNPSSGGGVRVGGRAKRVPGLALLQHSSRFRERPCVSRE